MKNLFRNWEWEHTWGVFFISLLILIISIITVFTLKDKLIRGYYLSGTINDLVIKVDINWYEDDKIILDRVVTYDEAVELVKKLNETVK